MLNQSKICLNAIITIKTTLNIVILKGSGSVFQQLEKMNIENHPLGKVREPLSVVLLPTFRSRLGLKQLIDLSANNLLLK